MIDAKEIINGLNQPTWQTEVKPKRTNRDIFLDGLSNEEIGKLFMIINCYINNFKGCPFEECKTPNQIYEWLGEKE